MLRECLTHLDLRLPRRGTSAKQPRTSFEAFKNHYYVLYRVYSVYEARESKTLSQPGPPSLSVPWATNLHAVQSGDRRPWITALPEIIRPGTSVRHELHIRRPDK